MSAGTGLLAFAVPRGRYAAASWPQVVACAFGGCVMRHVVDDEHRRGTAWRCTDHEDSAAALVEYGATLAERAHGELATPGPLTFDEPPRERRYHLRPTSREVA